MIDERVYRSHAPMVRRALRQLGVDAAHVDDATQDVFVVLHRRMADFRPREGEPTRSLANWLWGIARGVASTYRRSRRRRERLLAALPAPTSEHVHAQDERIARREAARMLERFLAELDADRCAVFVLAEIEGRTGPEIAARLGVNLNTVYARLRSARRAFVAVTADPRPVRAAGWMFAGAWGRGGALPFGLASAVAALSITISEPTPAPPYERMGYAIVPDAIAADRGALGREAAPRLAARIEGDPANAPDMIDTTTLLVALTLTLSPAAEAKPSPRPSTPVAAAPQDDGDEDEAALHAGDGTQRHYIFGDDELTGDVLNPDGTVIPQRPRGRHPSLIHIREHFNQELVLFATDV